MNNETRLGPSLILSLHTGGGTVGGRVGVTTPIEGPPIIVQPDRFGLPDDLVQALVHPVLNLSNNTMLHLVVERVANYTARLVRLMNAETPIESAVKEVLAKYNGKLRVINFAVNSDKVCFEEIRVQIEINEEPLHPNEPRPKGLDLNIHAAISHVLHSLEITVSKIVISSD